MRAQAEPAAKTAEGETLTIGVRGYPRASMWVRDVTEEGIEPHTEEACSYMRQPPPQGRRRPSTAAQAAGGPSYREIRMMFSYDPNFFQTLHHVRTGL